MGFLKFGYRTSPSMGDISGQHVVSNVDWIRSFESRELDPTSVIEIESVDNGFMARIMNRVVECNDFLGLLNVCCRYLFRA